MKFVLKMMDVALNFMIFVFKMMNFKGGAVKPLAIGSAEVRKAIID